MEEHLDLIFARFFRAFFLYFKIRIFVSIGTIRHPFSFFKELNYLKVDIKDCPLMKIDQTSPVIIYPQKVVQYWVAPEYYVLRKWISSWKHFISAKCKSGRFYLVEMRPAVQIFDNANGNPGRMFVLGSFD